MDTRAIIERYYDCVNRGAWDEWLTLFSDDVVGDEQLAGHFSGIDVLRGAVGAISSGYSRFTMLPQRIVVDGDAACVVWRCVAANAAGQAIAYPDDAARQVIGANYFQVQNGRIVYMRTIHDSVPFQPFTQQNARTGRWVTAMQRFDYVVVGGGSAGLRRGGPAQRGCGHDRRPARGGGPAPAGAVERDIVVPSHWGLVQHTVADWQYTQRPAAAPERPAHGEPRGRLPGGSSNLYILMHIRGHRSDFDNWAYNGCPGWSFETCLPLLPKARGPGRRRQSAGRARAGRCGSRAPHGTIRTRPRSSSSTPAPSCGFPQTEDFNGPQMEGAGWHHVNIKDGQRHSTRRLPRTGARGANGTWTLIDERAGDAAGVRRPRAAPASSTGAGAPKQVRRPRAR